MSIPVTVIGNATAEPELRYTQSGLAVCSVNIAINERILNKQTNEWEDGEPDFVRLSIWRDQAENFAGSVNKGDRIIATGKLKLNTYESKEGEKRSQMEMQVDEFGLSGRYATLTAIKVGRRDGNQSGGQRPAPAQRQSEDAWASSGIDDDSVPF
jgi:single-strand DNA-binding protein